MNIGSLYHVLLGERGAESLSHFMYVLHVPAEKIIQVIFVVCRGHICYYILHQNHLATQLYMGKLGIVSDAQLAR